MVEKFGESKPTLAPFTFHWYEGAAPPFVTEPLNIVVVPAQIAVEPVTAIVGVTLVLIIAVTAFEVAVVVLAQAAFEVKIAVTMSLFNKVELVNVAPVAAFTPFTFHW